MNKWMLIMGFTGSLFILMIYTSTCEGSELGDLGRAYMRQSFEYLPGIPYVPPTYHQETVRHEVTIDQPPAAPGAPRVITTFETQETTTSPQFNLFSRPAPLPGLYGRERFYFDENGMFKMRR
jgi:hypothetical protein